MLMKFSGMHSFLLEEFSYHLFWRNTVIPPKTAVKIGIVIEAAGLTDGGQRDPLADHVHRCFQTYLQYELIGARPVTTFEGVHESVFIHKEIVRKLVDGNQLVQMFQHILTDHGRHLLVSGVPIKGIDRRVLVVFADFHKQFCEVSPPKQIIAKIGAIGYREKAIDQIGNAAVDFLRIMIGGEIIPGEAFTEI